MDLSDYEKLREANLRQNRKILSELGLASDITDGENSSYTGSVDYSLTSGNAKIKQKLTVTRKRNNVQNQTTPLGISNGLDETMGRRKSERLSGIKRPKYTFDDFPLNLIETRTRFSLDEPKGRSRSEVWNPNKLDPSTYCYQKPKEPRENSFGSIEGVPVGTIFQSRMECNYSGIHRPPVSGIHGNVDGCYSVVLSGGYEDDVDLGDCFTYTGEGGRDLRGTKNLPKNLRTAPQSKDQELAKGNAALAKSIETRIPVRVVRGYRLNNKFAPKEGYRYDGLYTVEKYWMQQGLSGFNVYRFALKRCPKQGPAPWKMTKTT